MFEPNTQIENALRFSRFDEQHLLSTCARPLELENEQWRTAEHYVHTMLAGTPGLANRIRAAESGYAAYKLAKPWYRRKIKGWKSQRRLYMTRAVYTLVQMYSDIHHYVLDSGEQMIVETSQYDHYWGIGRDLRGENMLGKVWMDVRQRLREKARQQAH